MKNKVQEMLLWKRYELIHLGYLAYDLDNREAYIPNKEVQEAFEYAIEGARWSEVVNTVEASDRLLRNTWQQDGEAVAAVKMYLP